MGTAVVNPVDVIEAAYDLDADDRAWLVNLARAVRPLLDGGRGAYAYYYDAALPPERWLDDAVLIDASPAELVHARRLVAGGKQTLIEDLHTHPQPLEAALQAARAGGLGDLRARGPFAEFLRAMDARDYLAFRTIETGGKGVAISAGQVRERTIDRRTQQLWARVAAHIGAARRLRAALTPPDHAVEAVLTPSGRLEHAEGGATTVREALRTAVRRQERARGRQRRTDPDGATEAWTALVSGRWSLVDRFERDGRRYIVARANAHALPDPRGLTERERGVVHLAALGKHNKLSAYELGISASTVASHLSSAMKKLGARTRVDLIRIATAARGTPTAAR